MVWLWCLAMLASGSAPVRSAEPGGVKWAIVIGVQQYSERTGFAPLRYAEKDAQGVYDVLVDQQRGAYEEGRVELLTTAAQEAEAWPTRGNILGALGLLEKWSRADPDHSPDTVIVYFSGHGVEQDGQSYLVPVDAVRTDLANTALPLELVRQKLSLTGAKKQIVIVDACRFDSVPGKAGGEQQSVEFARALEEFARAEGRVVLASCSSNQASYENEERGHSAFTGILLDGLLGAADENADGMITLTESYEYLTRELRSWAEKRGIVQYPSLYGEITLTVPLVRCPKWVEVRIASVPDEAEIWVDGENTGQKTPHTLKIAVSATQERKLEVKLKKEGYQDLTREVTVRADSGAEVIVSLQEVSGSVPREPREAGIGEAQPSVLPGMPAPPTQPVGLPRVIRVRTDAMYSVDQEGREGWGDGVHLIIRTAHPRDVTVRVTDAFGQVYVGRGKGASFGLWQANESEVILWWWSKRQDRALPAGRRYVVEVVTPEGRDQLTTTPLPDYSPWRCPAITYPPNQAVITERLPTFAWEPFGPETTSYSIELQGPSDEWRPDLWGGDMTWAFGLSGHRVSAVFNEDGMAAVPQLTPGRDYHLWLTAEEAHPVARTDFREEIHTRKGCRIQTFHVAKGTLTP